MKVTPVEFQERLKWSLSQKIDHSLGVIDEFYSHFNGSVYCSFSGGKDSTVLLFLCRMLHIEIPAVFLNTTNEFPEVYKFVKSTPNLTWINPKMNLRGVIEKHGFPLISKEQSQYVREAKSTHSDKLRSLRINGSPDKKFGKISKKWLHLVGSDFDISERCCNELKKKPAKLFEKESGLRPIIGTLASESQLRKQKYYNTGCNIFSGKRTASYPLSIWTTENIWDFIHQNNIPYCDVYDHGETQTGCMVCGFGCHRDNRFDRLEKNYPIVFNNCMNYTNNGVTYSDAIKFALKHD